jgi:hypothetical protein
MSEMTADGGKATGARANLAAGASLLAVSVWVLGAVNEDLYTLLPIPAVAAVVLGLRARRDGSAVRRATVAAIVGGLLGALWLGFLVAYLAGWIDG